MTVTFHLDNDILIMTLTGNWSLPDAVPTRAESAQLQRKHNIRSILVDVRKARIELSTLELFDFCASFQSTFLPGTRHAVLYSHEDHDLSDITFAENVSRNRGVIMKMFTDHNDALEWLHANVMQ